MRQLFSAAALVVAALTLGWAVSQEPGDKRHPDDYWMKKKLELSQTVLQGITTEDYDLIRKAATTMRRLSDIESFARRKDTKAYRAQLAVFEIANDDLIAQAEAKNVDAATAAFTQLTLSCVHCHKQLRDGGK